MKTKDVVVAVVSTVVLSASLVSCATASHRETKLQAESKITRAEAEKIALAKVPGGTIREGEIEKEKGQLIWSFDITTPGTTDITEVHVSALNGDVIAIEKEGPAKEKKKDKD